MSQSFKICPICGTPAHRNAPLCSTCGATLTDVPAVSDGVQSSSSKPDYDPLYGETDLFEGSIHRRGEVFLFGGMMALAVIACAVVVIAFAPRLFGIVTSSLMGSRAATPTLVPTRAAPGSGIATAPALSGDIPLYTNTPRPTIKFSTVTPAPPAPTITPPPGPCTRVVQPGDDLISIAWSCGHRSMDVMPLILEANNLDSAELIRVGQTLEIPWPTPTLDPNSIPTETPTKPDGVQIGALDDSGSTRAPIEQAMLVSASLATETLQPGVTWHRVRAGENIISIAYAYGADVEILSQLNPQITFSQCDYSMDTGGPNCIVTIYEGQLVRVPAPTPTPTLSPTLSGSETATPSPSPTFNAPSPLSPDNRSLFRRAEFITLRWVPSGTLAPGQVYRVRIRDETARKNFHADTLDIFFIIPPEWQGSDTRRHEYTWTVSVIDSDNPDNPYFTTQPRTFTWEGRVAPTPEPAQDKDDS